jgi:hypothetical protein
MKLKLILESPLREVRRWQGRGGEETYGSEFSEYLSIKWREDFTSVRDALDGYASEDEWYDIAADAAAKAGHSDDIEDLKINDNDVSKFRSVVLDDAGNLTPDLSAALAKYAKSYDDFKDSGEAEEYRDSFHDQSEFEDDPHSYYGVRRSDFY